MKASCALHNWIRKSPQNNHVTTADVEDTENNSILFGSWRQDPPSHSLLNMSATRETNFTTAARQKRAQLVDYFMAEDEDELQYRMVNRCV